MALSLCLLVYAAFLIFEESSCLKSVSAPLVHHVLSTPGLHLIPIHEPGHRLNISLVVGVQSIDKVDKRRNQVEASLMVSESWPSGVSWNPGDFNGISRQVIHKSQIWTPDIIIENSVSSPVVFSPPNVILMSHGVAVFNKHFKIVLVCDTTENNQCMAKFQSSGFANNLVVLNGPEYMPFDMSLFLNLWVNSGGRFQARDGTYEKSHLDLIEGDRLVVDVITYWFSIKDTRPHYRNRPSKMTLSWN